MVRYILTVSFILLASPAFATWSSQGYVEDTSPDGGEKVFTENTAGTVNNFMTIDTAGTYILLGNAATSTALAANGANCSAGSYALGVDASGASEGCTDATTEIDSAIATASANYEPVKGADDNYVTDAEKIVIGNTSGANTGDQAAGDFNHDDLANITGTAAQYNHPTDAQTTVIGNTSGTNTGDNITMSNFDGTAWRVFYTDGSGDVIELALGANGTYLSSNGATSAPTFEAPAGAGDLLADGTVPLTANWDVGAFTITGTQFISDIAIGTAPFVVTSTTPVTNLAIAGNAGTSTALAANGANCSAGNYPLGVDASGAVEDCTAAGTGSGDLLANGTVPMTADWSFGAFDITGGVDSTWSGQGSFGTMTAGAAGFTVDADGDTTAKSVTITPSATPSLTFEDSDDAAGTATIYANSDGGANDVILSIGVEDSTGESTEYLQVDGVTETVDFLKPTTLQAGDIVLAEMAVNSVDSDQYIDGSIDLAHMSVNSVDSDQYVDGSIDIAHMSTDSVDYDNTTGSFKSVTPVVDDCDDFAATFTGANLYGGTFVANLAGTCQLPAIAAGMNFCITTVGAIALIVEPNASDSQLLDGTQLDDADSATNLSTAGDIICYQYLSAAGWLSTSNGWTDED